MPINDFDRGLIDKFEAHDYEYNPAQWDRLAKQLPPVPNKRIKRYIWLPLSGIAAAIALLLGVPAMKHFQQDERGTGAARVQPKTAVTAPAAVAANKPMETTVTTAPAPAAATNASGIRIGISALQNSSSSYSGHHTAGIHTAPVNNTSSTSVSSQEPAAPSNDAMQPAQSLANNNNNNNNNQPDAAPATQSPVAPAQQEVQKVEAPVRQQPVSSVAANLLQDPVKMKSEPAVDQMRKMMDSRFDNGIDPDDIGLKKKDKALFSLAGGYNRGTTNLGYMVGVNTRKNLNGKLYFEGDVAFAANRNDLGTYNMSSDIYTDEVKRQMLASQVTPKAANAEQVTNRYYLQVTPVVGYQAMKKLSFGAGADVQRMFQSDGRTSFIIDKEAGAVKTVPVLDYGLVGKTEYTLFRNLKAGVQYRYGMNNLFTGSGKEYINRSYLQVQLKLGILGTR